MILKEMYYDGNICVENLDSKFDIPHSYHSILKYGYPPEKRARKIKETRERVSLMLDEFKIHEAIISINELITFGDRYINENAIWKDTESKKEKVFNAVVLLDNVASFYQPFLPETSWNISKNIVWLDKKILEVKKGESLFPRLK